MVFQNFALYPHLSARQNMKLGLRHGLKLSRAEAEARVAEVAKSLEITDLLDRRPGKISGGQRQRVALGRALARQAEVVLLDEPWSGLDAQLKQDLRLEIRTILRSLGTTAIFVTHDQLDAMAIGDRIAVMRAGKIVQIGTPEEIYEHPASTFVAKFVGSPPMNLIPAAVVEGRLQSPAQAPLPVQGVPDGEVWVGVRPERLLPEGSGEYRLRGQVIAAELSAGEWIVHLRVGGQVVAVRADLPARPQPESPMDVAASRAAIRLFDRQTGKELEL
jgi:ABC-type sugar transport system ATPase subunit